MARKTHLLSGRLKESRPWIGQHFDSSFQDLLRKQKQHWQSKCLILGPREGQVSWNWSRTGQKVRLKTTYLLLSFISLSMAVPHKEACDSLVSKAVDMWKDVKKRRKLPYHKHTTRSQQWNWACHSNHDRTRYRDADRCNINHWAADHPRGVWRGNKSS